MSAWLKQQQEIAEKDFDEKAERWLSDIGGDLVDISPVWSGAYVLSHSIRPKGSGGGRMRKSTIKKVDPGPVKDKARSQLKADATSFSFTEAGGVVIRNRSEHARIVEDGGVAPNGTTIRGRNVYRTVSAKWG